MKGQRKSRRKRSLRESCFMCVCVCACVCEGEVGLVESTTF